MITKKILNIFGENKKTNYVAFHYIIINIIKYIILLYYTLTLSISHKQLSLNDVLRFIK